MNTSAIVSPARPEGTRSESSESRPTGTRTATPSFATPSPRFRALSSEDLRRAAPSVFAEHARPGVSARYTFVSTAQVVALLGAEGWLPVKASEQRVRLEDRIGFQMHELRFARRSDIDAGTFNVGDTRPEMILQNAHDGSRAYRIDAGLYRLVCRNGLTVADAGFAHVSIRHMDVSADAFAQAAQAVAENTPRVLETVAAWRAVQLSQAAQVEFARRAFALRWDASQTVAKFYQPERLLVPVRDGDAAPDLWTVFNRVQERLVRGGDRYMGFTEGVGFRRNRIRPVSGLTEGQRLNKTLWNLAEEFSRN